MPQSLIAMMIRQLYVTGHYFEMYPFCGLILEETCLFLSSATKKDSEDAILSEIRKCTQAVNNNVIEHTAYIRAAAEKKQMDLDKYKDQVRKEMQSTSKNSGGELFIPSAKMTVLF